jgi:predicted outer membrane lipoprotein
VSDLQYGTLLGASAATAFWVVAALLFLRHLDRQWRERLEAERAAYLRRPRLRVVPRSAERHSR